MHDLGLVFSADGDRIPVSADLAWKSMGLRTSGGGGKNESAGLRMHNAEESCEWFSVQ